MIAWALFITTVFALICYIVRDFESQKRIRNLRDELRLKYKHEATDAKTIYDLRNELSGKCKIIKQVNRLTGANNDDNCKDGVHDEDAIVGNQV